MRALDAVLGTTWAITESALATIVEIATRENLNPEAVAAQLGRPLDNTHTVTHRDGIAVIPVEGPIFPKANLFTEISGATSIEILARDLHTALIDPSIRGILLDVDSPGGEISGVSEYADMIYAARDTKPITAYVGNLGCSAAYWIASSASEVVVDATASLGSIGVVAAVRDPTKSQSKDVQFVSSQSPNKRPDPTTERGKAQLQGTVDALADVFVAAVARNRGVSTDTVLADFGAGGLLVGQTAVEAGLADRVGSFEETLGRMAGLGRMGAPWPREAPRAEEDGTMAADEKTARTEDPRVADMQRQLETMQRQQAETQSQYAAMQAQNAAMAAQHAEMAARLRVSAAKTFVAGLVREGRALPAEEDALAALHIRAAADDDAHGVAAGETSRVAQVVQTLQARTPHGLFGERVKTGDASVLTNPQGGDAAIVKEAADAAREWARKANGKGGKA